MEGGRLGRKRKAEKRQSRLAYLTEAEKRPAKCKEYLRPRMLL